MFEAGLLLSNEDVVITTETPISVSNSQNDYGRSFAASTNGMVQVFGGPPMVGWLAGGIRLYENIAGTWTINAQFTSLMPATRDYLGTQVDISADGTVVVASGSGIPGYIFTKSGGTWSRQSIGTTINGICINDAGTQILASQTTDSKVHVFTLSGGTWSDTGNFGVSGKLRNSRNGLVCSIDGNVYENIAGTWTSASFSVGDDPTFNYDGTAAVSSTFTSPVNQGSVRMYKKTGSWAIEATFNGALYDQYNGSSMNAAGDFVVVGAAGSNTHTSPFTVLFQRLNGSWSISNTIQTGYPNTSAICGQYGTHTAYNDFYHRISTVTAYLAGGGNGNMYDDMYIRTAI